MKGGSGIGIVVSKSDPNLSGRVKVIELGREGPNVKEEHKSWSSTVSGGHAQGGASTNHGPEVGSLVSLLDNIGVSGPTGSSFNYVGSVLQSIPNFTGLPGGASLMDMFGQYFDQDQGMHLPPDTEETTRDGAKIRKVKEKGQDFSYRKLSGIPTHASTPPLFGMFLPEVKNIATAKQSFTSILSGVSLPGLNIGGLSITSLLNMLPKEIMDELPQELKNALSGLENFSQSVSVSSTASGFTSGTQVSLDKFIENITPILKESKTISDLMTGLVRMTSDESLFGADELPKLEIEIDTPFGKVKAKLGSDGTITKEIPDIIQELMDSFSRLLSSFQDLPGADGKKSLFGDMAKNLEEMHTRLPPSIEKARKKAIEELAKSSESKRINEFYSKFMRGGKVG